MNQNQLLNLVQRHGYNARTQQDEILIESCIYCGNPNWNLELNADKGVFKCWACNSSGTLQKFLAEHFDYHENISVDLDNKNKRSNDGEPAVVFGAAFRSAGDFQSARNWLKKRKIRPSDINKYDIKLCVDEDHAHANRLVFPLRNYWAGDFCGYISRDYIGLGGPKYKVHIDYDASYGYRRGNSTPHVIVEGVIDGIRVHQAGFNALVLLGTGSNDRFLDWVSSVPRQDEVVLLLDGDKAGRKNANRLKHLAATVRDEPIDIELPEAMDPADLDYVVLQKLIRKHLEEA